MTRKFKLVPAGAVDIDEAMSLFCAFLRERFPSMPSAGEAELARASRAVDPMGLGPDDDEHRFRLAEKLLRSLCPETASCRERSCRRSGRCLQLAELARLRQQPMSVAARRPPGAVALRKAIWVFVNRTMVGVDECSMDMTPMPAQRVDR